MVIRRLVLRDFRSYERADLDLGPGLTAFVGPNAVGKTNLLEAVYFAATGASPRTARDTDLIRVGAGVCYVRVEWDDPLAGRRTIEIACHRQQGKALRIDGRKRQRLADLYGQLPVVYFAPETLALIKHGPAARRAFLDHLLIQLDPGYAARLQEYQRILAQRNQLLREIRAGRASTALLAIWDEPLHQRGTAIRRRRAEVLARLEPLVAAAARRLGAGGAWGEGAVRLLYVTGDGEEPAADPQAGAGPGGVAAGGAGPGDGPGSGDPAGGAALAAEPAATASERYREEIARGVTLWGPQRDEFRVFLDGRDARVFASQGQQRSLVLALKLAEVELMRAELGRAPVLLLDDVLSELDGRRRELLLEAVGGTPQVLLTATEEPAIPAGVQARVVSLPLAPPAEAGEGPR